jgi:hypothetical protein
MKKKKIKEIKIIKLNEDKHCYECINKKLDWDNDKWTCGIDDSVLFLDGLIPLKTNNCIIKSLKVAEIHNTKKRSSSAVWAI